MLLIAIEPYLYEAAGYTRLLAEPGVSDRARRVDRFANHTSDHT